MKHLALAWLSLTPFMSWGVTPEEQQLQQRLEEIRQQLILQNRALHEVQAQLDSSRAANGSAEGGNAAAEPTRRSADPGRSTEDLLLEEHNVFNRQWMIDFGVTYQHYDRKDLALRGFLALDAIFLGEINLDRVRSDQWIADLTTRYTLSDRWQLELQLPYVMRYSRYQSTGKENASTALEEAKVNGSDLGDMSLAVYYRLMMEDGRWPDLVWNLRGKVPSGKDPYGIEVDYSPSGNLITPQELATGDGVWQLSTGFSAVKTWIQLSCLPVSITAPALKRASMTSLTSPATSLARCVWGTGSPMAWGLRLPLTSVSASRLVSINGSARRRSKASMGCPWRR